MEDLVSGLLRPNRLKSDFRAKDKWGSETEGHKTNEEVDKMDSTNMEFRFSFVCISCLLY